MKKILFLILASNKPSSRLRMLPVVERMQARGHQITVIEIPAALPGKLGLLWQARQHDLVVLQKKLLPAALLKFLLSANQSVIYDVDDAVLFHELERGELLGGKFFTRYVDTCRQVRQVVAGNRMLAEFAAAARATGGQDVRIVPSAVDCDLLYPDAACRTGDGFVAGWIGTKGNLYQLELIADVLRQAQRDIPGFVLRVIADKAPELPGVTVDFRSWSKAGERTLLAGLDVGLMPLEDTLWNRGKGGFKLLQYMAAGVPGIASPVGINSDIVTHGSNGLLARGHDEWHAALVRLAATPDERQAMGQQARQTIEAKYSLAVYLDTYAQLIEACLK